MKKKLSFLLCFAMLLGMLAVPVSAVTADPLMEPYDVAKILIDTDSTITGDSYVGCKITVIDEEGGEYETFVDEDSKIKIRGNSTSSANKKPFNIKLSAKADILGMGKNKKWSILANCYDKTMMRNMLAFDMAKSLGLDYISDYRVCDVYLNGEYNGCYIIVDSVEVGDERVDIDTSANEFLLELDYNPEDEDCQYFYSPTYNIKFAINEPEKADLTDEQYAWLMDFMADAEAAVWSEDIEEIKKYFDIDSMVDFYLMLEFFRNIDAGTSSTRFYIKDGKIHGGPIWDYDLSSGNYSASYYGLNRNTNYQGYSARRIPWYDDMMENCYEFQDAVYLRFGAMTDLFVNLVDDNIVGKNKIDTYLEKYGKAFERNNELWATDRVHHPSLALELEPYGMSYEDHVDYLRDWIINRHDWLLNEWDYMDYDETFVAPDSSDDARVVPYFITRVDVGTTANDLRELIGSEWYFYDTYDFYEFKEIQGDDLIATGYCAFYSWVNWGIAVTGDINGDAEVTYIDYMLLKRAVMGTFDVTPVQSYASDINDKDGITYVDYMLLKRAVMGSYDLTAN